ncbi:MAG: biopolymer transporter ExbD [Kiritimatiellae bacterium]|nr:biopolymer transporter ExbD [Kiritimatiellia bacterium]
MHPSIRLVERHRLRPRMELTALVDCVFLLLVFFLLTSTYSRQRQLDLSLQPMQGGLVGHPDSAPVALEINAEGQIRLQGEVLAEAGLLAFLAQQAAADSTRKLSLIADQQAPAGRILSVLDQARLAGLTEVNLVGKDAATASEAPE